MKILSIILGILLAICGISCIFTPLGTFLQAGYFFAILLIIYGIMGIAGAVKTKEYKLNFAFGIVSLVAGIAMALMPVLQLMTDAMLVYVMAVWFVVQGIVSIYFAVSHKEAVAGKGWIWGIVLGVLGIILGIYSFAHPMLVAFSLGILIGFYFIESGVTMVVAALQNSDD